MTPAIYQVFLLHSAASLWLGTPSQSAYGSPHPGPGRGENHKRSRQPALDENAFGREWLSVDDIRTLLGESATRPLPRSTWQQWRAEGKTPPCYRLPNGSLRIRRADFEHWLAGFKEP